MEPLGLLSTAIIIGCFAFVMGRNFQREGQMIPHRVRRYLPRDRRNLVGALTVGSLALSALFSGFNRYDGTPYPLFFFSLATYWLLLPYWVYLDAKSRGTRAWAWALMALFTNVMGLCSYLISRPERATVCSRCGYKLREDFIACPYCGPEAGKSCPHCNSMLDLDWNYCPFCLTNVKDYSYPDDSPNDPPIGDDGPLSEMQTAGGAGG
jgi:RNA polymerase subunit RPABC4/transcription elongation factor Spt4